MVEGSVQAERRRRSERGRREPWAHFTSVTCPPCSRDSALTQALFESAWPGKFPPPPVGSHTAGSRQRLCPESWKKVKRRWRERGGGSGSPWGPQATAGRGRGLPWLSGFWVSAPDADLRWLLACKRAWSKAWVSSQRPRWDRGKQIAPEVSVYPGNPKPWPSELESFESSLFIQCITTTAKQ